MKIRTKKKIFERPRCETCKKKPVRETIRYGKGFGDPNNTKKTAKHLCRRCARVLAEKITNQAERDGTNFYFSDEREAKR